MAGPAKIMAKDAALGKIQAHRRLLDFKTLASRAYWVRRSTRKTQSSFKRSSNINGPAVVQTLMDRLCLSSSLSWMRESISQLFFGCVAICAFNASTSAWSSLTA
jgi:hypothetical protein